MPWSFPEAIHPLDVDDPGVLLDADTLDDLSHHSPNSDAVAFATASLAPNAEMARDAATADHPKQPVPII